MGPSLQEPHEHAEIGGAPFRSAVVDMRAVDHGEARGVIGCGPTQASVPVYLQLYDSAVRYMYML